jgi:hypothetical protein
MVMKRHMMAALVRLWKSKSVQYCSEGQEMGAIALAPENARKKK